jgi:hypothetical protein
VAEMRRERRGASVPRFFDGRSSPPSATASVMKQTVKTLTNFGKMSNAEYRQSVREQYGFDPGV